MIKVYFESSSHADEVATFATEDLYMACLPTLEAKAAEARMVVTETMGEDCDPSTDYKVLRAGDPESLGEKVAAHIAQGWVPVGSHQVVVVHSQNRFRGSEHVDTQHKTDYTQTIIKTHK